MSTDYNMIDDDICPCCGRSGDSVHIGTLTAEHFYLRLTEEELEECKNRVDAGKAYIKNIYGDKMNFEEFMSVANTKKIVEDI